MAVFISLFILGCLFGTMSIISGQAMTIEQSLLAVLAEESHQRTRLQQDMRDISSEIALLQHIQNNVTCGCPIYHQPIAFSATLTRDITNLGARQQIVFDRVIANIGAGYDARHGQFRAPLTGAYEFNVAMLMNPGHWAGVEIVRDGTAIGKVRTGDSQQWTMAAGIVVVELAAGQDVWVEHIAETDNNVIYGQTFSSFSGHLIQI